ncbi:MAG: CaiB/BaiF CoA transferase family protein [Lautropia sp.]
MSTNVLQPDPGVLSGLLVLDFGQAAVGPVAACYLGMMGATVIKIEAPIGDMVRSGAPTMKGTSTTFIGNNLTKYGVMLDLKQPDGLAAAKTLIAKADVLIENFRSPAIMERLGLGYDAVLSKLNPRLIYVQSSAFGAEGPWTGMFSNEWMTECVSGFVHATGGASGRGEFTRGSALLDWNGAMINTIVCLAAILQRSRSGTGMMVRTSQLGSSVFTSLTRLAEAVATGAAQGPLGSASAFLAPDQAFRAADGFVNVSVPAEKFWPRLCNAIGLPGLAADPRFADNAARLRNRAALVALLGERFRTRPVADWVECLAAADVPCNANPPRDSLTAPQLAHPQVAANGMLTRVDSAYGSILTQTPHWVFEKTPAAIPRPSPLLGEHTELVLEAVSKWQPYPVASGTDAGAPTGVAAGGGALAGLRVVELAAGIPGPLAGMVLTQLGAEVVRVEAPDGDWLRAVPPLVDGTGAVYRTLNAGKRTIVADLKSADGRAAVHRELAEADVVLVGFREHKLGRLGIDRDTVARLNPRALFCHLSGWGPRGPERDRAATELLVQAVAGMPRYVGTDGAEPVRLGFDLASTAAGLAAVQGILAGLVRRAATGESQRIDVSMLASAIAINQWSTVAESGPDAPTGSQLRGQEWPRDHGFASRDGPCLIGFRQTDLWRRFVVAIGRVDLLTDPEFVAAIESHPPRFAPKVEATLRAWSFAALDRLVRGELGGTIVPVLDVLAIAGHEQVRNLGIIDRRDGGLRVSLPLATTAALLAPVTHAVTHE